MPIMNLGDWNAGINKYTCHCLWATMCFPDELSSRQQYLNKKVIEWRGEMKDKVVGNAVGVRFESIENPIEQAVLEIEIQRTLRSHIEESVNKGFEKYHLHSGGDQVTAKAPSLDQIESKIKNSSLYKGFTAGLILFKILQLHHHRKNGGSINKAIYLMEKFYKGTNIPNSRESIRNAWRDFKSVSHYWAAAVFLYSEFKGTRSFGFIEWLESDPQNNLLRFLGCAEYYRKLGEKHLPNEATTVTTLDPKESWVLPEEFPIQKRLPRVPKLQNWEIEALENYKALPHQ